MDPKDVPICYDLALLFLKQKKQKKLIKYSPVIALIVLGRNKKEANVLV